MPHDRFLTALASELATLDARGNPKRHESVIVGVLPRGERLRPALPARRPRPAALPEDELEQLPRHEPPPRGDRRRGGGVAQVRRRPRRGALHQRHLRAARRARAEAGDVPRPRSGDDLLLRLRDDDRHLRAAGDERDRARLRRAEPQLHHQRHQARPPEGEARLQAQRHGRLRGEAGRGRGELPARAGDHRRHLLDARRPGAARRAVRDRRKIRRALPRERRRPGRRLARRRRLRPHRPRHRGAARACARGSDLLIGTLGKAFGVNGGYVVGPKLLVDFLRETAPMYIYSNPITPAEAAAAQRRGRDPRRPGGRGPASPTSAR